MMTDEAMKTGLSCWKYLKLEVVSCHTFQKLRVYMKNSNNYSIKFNRDGILALVLDRSSSYKITGIYSQVTF